MTVGPSVARHTKTIRSGGFDNGIDSASRAAALIVAGVFVVAIGSTPTRRQEADAQLETKDDASVRPWKRYSGWPARDMSKFNTLGNLASPPAPRKPRKLTGPITGDAANGAELVADRNRGGSCLACHVMGPAGDANLPGNVGSRSVRNRQCRAPGRVAVQLRL